MSKKAAFYTLGCKVNSYETDAMREIFERASYDIVDFKETADIYIINTCTVTNIADRKSRQMLHQAKKRNSDAIIVAVGCYVQAKEEELLKDMNVDIVVGNNRKSDILSLVEAYKVDRKKDNLIVDINREDVFENLQVSDTLDKTRLFIKIQEGCNRFCSYCIIPYVRGRIRSRQEEDVLNEINLLVSKGYKEFVLTGIHLSSYGLDFNNQESEEVNIHLGNLIKKISYIDGVERIRLGSLEPMVITKEFVDIISNTKAFCPHFHLSLQSGSDSVLKRMNRRYTSAEYYEKVLMLKEAFDNPSFTTDIIVGFPGETEEEFEETKEFVEKVGFLDIHVFKFSKREGTKAAIMKAQVNDSIKSSRSNTLIELGNKVGNAYREEFIGQESKILVETEEIINNEKYYIGHNKKFIKLAFKSNGNKDLINNIHKVRLLRHLTKEILLCELID